jgi:hypothetical protein
MKDQHVIGFFYQPMLDLQKEYARLLLTHRNPYTGLTYAAGPCRRLRGDKQRERAAARLPGRGVTDRMPGRVSEPTCSGSGTSG